MNEYISKFYKIPKKFSFRPSTKKINNWSPLHREQIPDKNHLREYSTQGHGSTADILKNIRTIQTCNFFWFILQRNKYNYPSLIIVLFVLIIVAIVICQRFHYVDRFDRIYPEKIEEAVSNVKTFPTFFLQQFTNDDGDWMMDERDLSERWRHGTSTNAHKCMSNHIKIV